MREIISTINNIIKTTKKNIIKKSLKKLNIISREEFEIYKKIMLKTRKKLEDLEIKLNKSINDKNKI